MLELFKAKAEAVSAEVLRVPSPAAALDAISAVLGREGVEDAPGERAVWCEGPILRGSSTGRARPALPRPLLRGDEGARPPTSRVGVSEFDWALAATGTIAQDATDPRLRLVSMLTETHVALFRTATLLPDLECLLARVDPRRTRYLACVTGPSRTADIERVLTIGVHGPRRLVDRRGGRRDAGGADGGTGASSERIADALENGQLAGALGRFNEAYVASRARAYEGIDFEALRDRLVALKDRAAARLDELAARVRGAGDAGGRQGVPHLRSRGGAGATSLRLCRERGVRRIAKSKSMATEEIHLNAHLEKRGHRASRRPTSASGSSSSPGSAPRTW